MTVCAIETSADPEDDTAPPAGCALTADGAYAARLALSGGCWYPERWTLDGPEPYAVPLPAHQPEEPGTEVQPMGDGRVLVHRVAAGRHVFALLYPTGPGTGELPLGAVECAEGTRLRLLPPAPGGERAYAVAAGRHASAVWLVAGGPFGPEKLAEIPGRCAGGVWLDRTERMLALDRRAGGRTKAVVVDLARGGEVSPLLQITPDSDDRVVLADPDSGLLLVRSDAPSPGRPRLGWGVLGSTLPVRFPECLRLPDCVVTPFAIQPGQALAPESCAVALRVDGRFGSWVGIWRPADRRMHHLPAPEGWLAGAGAWTADGALRLPYATAAVPCGLARPAVPAPRADGPGGPGREGDVRRPAAPGAGVAGRDGTNRSGTAGRDASAGRERSPGREGDAERDGAAGPGGPVRDGTRPPSAGGALPPTPGGGGETAPGGGGDVTPGGGGDGPPDGFTQPTPTGHAKTAPGGYTAAAPGTPHTPSGAYARPVPTARTHPAPDGITPPAPAGYATAAPRGNTAAAPGTAHTPSGAYARPVPTARTHPAPDGITPPAPAAYVIAAPGGYPAAGPGPCPQPAPTVFARVAPAGFGDVAPGAFAEGEPGPPMGVAGARPVPLREAPLGRLVTN